MTIWLLGTASIVAYAFWHNDLVYSLPTPVPNNYHPPKVGDSLSVFTQVKRKTNKPLFLHFFNPDCPCSRFNIQHFKQLVNSYHSQLEFAIVVLTNKPNYTANDIADKFNLDLPVYFDSSIAKNCGVISTPQAVLVNTNQSLYYRGNYNTTRYCTNKQTEYARMAIDSLLANQKKPVFGSLALTSYGCSIPSCKK